MEVSLFKVQFRALYNKENKLRLKSMIRKKANTKKETSLNTWSQDGTVHQK